MTGILTLLDAPPGREFGCNYFIATETVTPGTKFVSEISMSILLNFMIVKFWVLVKIS